MGFRLFCRISQNVMIYTYNCFKTKQKRGGGIQQQGLTLTFMAVLPTGHCRMFSNQFAAHYIAENYIITKDFLLFSK